MDLSAIALQGLQQSEAQLDRAAVNLASFGGSSVNGAGVDTVDLSAEAVALTSAQTRAEFSIKTLKTADEIQKTAIDLIA